MSDIYPPAGDQSQPGAEYLEAGGGSRLSTTDPEPSGRGRKRGLLIGGAVAALGVVGVGAWAASSFFATGAQPDEALPAGTLGYASIDLDPSGGQKIEALRTLNKFPAFKDELGLSTDDDIRKKLFDELEQNADCGLDYAQDVEPWLGNRLAYAVVDTGGDSPSQVVVVQVKDGDAADKGLQKLQSCGNTTDGGWVIDGDWAIVAETKPEAQKVVDAADQGTLADDADYQALTSAAGDPGIVRLYAAPAAGKYLGDLGGGLAGLAGDVPSLDGATSGSGSGVSDALKNFKGLAVAVRFSDGALEVESAGDSGLNLKTLYSSDRGTDVMSTLPDDTAAAIGVGLEPGWVTELVDQVAGYAGSDTTADDLLKEASDATGLDLPADAETLLGSSFALSLGSDFDVEEFANSTDPSSLPVALKVQGDPDQIKTVLGEIAGSNSQDPDVESFLGSDADGDMIAIGPNADYRASVLQKGDLGNNEVFKDVVREADKASAVFFLNFNVGDDWLVRAAGTEDKSVAENLKPLAGFGVTAWMDDDYAHAVLRLTTD